MTENELHLVRPELRPIKNDFQHMKVDMSIDSIDYGQRKVPRPSVPLENWQLDAFQRTVEYTIQTEQEPLDKKDEAFGTYLLKLLLSKSEWQNILGSFFKQSNDEVILDVTTGDRDLLTYPWEACAHANWNELGLSPPANEIAVVRTPGPYKEKWPVYEPVRILVAGVSSFGLPAPNFNKEYRVIVESLTQAGKQQGFEFDINQIIETSHQQLQMRVSAFQPHVVHLITHGEYGQHYLESPNGQPILVPTSSLVDALKAGINSLCLFVSTACMAMQENPEENTWGLGRRLASIVPVTIGMQIAISEEAALAFTQEFYASLGASYPVLKAYVHARERIRQQRPGSPEWIAPVLYRGTSKNTFLFSPIRISVILSNYVDMLDKKIQGLRIDNYNGELWRGVETIINDIDTNLIDGIQKKKIRLPDEQLPFLKKVEGQSSELRGNINNLKRFLLLSERVKSNIELADLEFKYDLGSKFSYSFELAKKLRNCLMEWLEIYNVFPR